MPNLTIDNKIVDQRGGNNSSGSGTLNRTGFIFDADANGAEGHVRFSNGFCLQWGQADSTGTNPTVTFGIPFTSWLGGIAHCTEFPATGGGESIAVNGATDVGGHLTHTWPATGMMFHAISNNAHATSGVGRFHWFAWGLAADE